MRILLLYVDCEQPGARSARGLVAFGCLGDDLCLLDGCVPLSYFERILNSARASTQVLGQPSVLTRARALAAFLSTALFVWPCPLSLGSPASSSSSSRAEFFCACIAAQPCRQGVSPRFGASLHQPTLYLMNCRSSCNTVAGASLVAPKTKKAYKLQYAPWCTHQGA